MLRDILLGIIFAPIWVLLLPVFGLAGLALVVAVHL